MADFFKQYTPGSHLVICDVCGKKKQAKECRLISDKYNTLFGMLVCRRCDEKTHPQARPYKVHPEKPLNPKFIRIEQPDVEVYTSTSAEIENRGVSGHSGIAPGAPLKLRVIGATEASVELTWDGPTVPGSSAISAFIIQRESPVDGGFSTIYTNNGASYYADTDVDSATEYNYRVYAVNLAGTSSASNSASVTTQ